ncbi:hypothetical protein [Lysinibacillus sp. fls2-241-R2A-57]|uniref:hypothetical protein n=1 Tax=Lysinibacillus sp. fls2-241-R2A-57 TaxID=3040292 RepID=UPI0025542F49|nr:hypothetical protein [Lysinibacillus sp. fls2-241-R2A-57]
MRPWSASEARLIKRPQSEQKSTTHYGDDPIFLKMLVFSSISLLLINFQAYN